ncbi:hypothetical protein D3C78_662410 [compost metagenome]
MPSWLNRRFGKARLIKNLPHLQVDIHDGVGHLVARVGKTLYVRLKPQERQA